MDGHQFDALARRVAVAAPRRAILRAVAGAAAAVAVGWARGGRALAQDGSLAAGAECTSTVECSQAGGPTVCADNGYADDGARNCCRNAGGACADATYSRDCCGGLYCRNGVCTDLSATGDLPPGSYCTATSECSQASGTAVCGDNGVSTDGALNCCLQEGGTCNTSDTFCCGNLTCVGGVCTAGGEPPATGGDVAPGGACTSTSQCSQAAGPGTAICADNGIADDGGLNCCLLEAVVCGSDNECCAGLVCANNGVTELACCTLEGNACDGDTGCCQGLVCVEGFCQSAA